MKRDFEYIVIGCGGIGSAALYWLSRRAGKAVLGLEQFELFHTRGASQDYSRIIRLYYHDNKYVPLTPHSYTAWATVEAESGVRVVTKTGGVVIADCNSPHNAALDVYEYSLKQLFVGYERIDRAEIERRFSGICPPWEIEALYQADTGIADPSKGNAAHIALARLNGATIQTQCAVRAIHPTADGGARIETSHGEFSCRRLIVTADAWVNQLIEPLLGRKIPVRITQEQVTYYATPHLKQFAIGRFPVFQWKNGISYYGFPVYGEVATKAAIDNSGHEVTADTRTFEPDPARERELTAFLAQRMPNFVGPKLYTKTCLYTMPLDRHFVLDALPGLPQIFVFVGGGHAYKFASLIGKILGELAIDGHTDYPIAPFSLLREAMLHPERAVYEYV